MLWIKEVEMAREYVENSEHASLLSIICKGDHRIQVPLSLTRGPRRIRGRQCGMRKRRYFRFGAALFSQSTSGIFVPASTPCCTCCLGSFSTSVAQGNLDCVSKKMVFVHYISFAQCLTPCTVHSALCPLHLPLSLVSKGWSHPEHPAQIHENPEVTVLRTQNLSQVMSPKGSSTKRPLLNKRLRTLLKKVRLLKLRMRARCATRSL